MNTKMPKIAMGAWSWGAGAAAVYGGGTSEHILGNFAKELHWNEVILSTKFTPQIADGTPDAMQHMIDGSKEHLHTDVIDLYWIHNPMDVERWTPDLIPLAKSGQIKAIGISDFGRKEHLAQQGNQMQSWASFTEGRRNLFTEPLLNQIGAKYGKIAGQMALRYLTKNGIAVIPPSLFIENAWRKICTA